MSESDVIKMTKRFDYSSSSEFNAAYARVAGDSKSIFLDCSLLEYIDSAGIGLLVMTQKKAQARKSTLIITHLKDSAREILELANVQKLIEIK